MQNLHDLAMFRFNFWHKPFLSPPAAHQPFPPGMESSSFIPNPLGTPALMVLASTAENHEGRMTGNSRFNSPENKESTPQFSTANYTMYRPGEHFPAPIYAPVHPFVRAASDRSGVRLVHPAGSSAFRPVATENPEQFHSAFSPAKRPKPEDLSTKSYSSSVETNESNANNDFIRDLSKEDRPSSLSSVNYDTSSETHSEIGDGDRQTPDSEGRSLRKQRKKLILDGQTPHCPVCGLTLRPGEIDTHLQVELEKLEKLSVRNSRKSRENTPQGRKVLPSPGSRGKESPGVGAASQARYEYCSDCRDIYIKIRCESSDNVSANYLRIQNNRQARLGARNRTRKKKLEETVCPVCNKKVSGTPEELNEHVELCLKKRDDELEPVDVEAEDVEQYEEYTWAGQTRIRASTMLDGGYAGSGFQVASCSSQGQDEDCDLNVDDDDSEKYGKPQYGEADVIPCASDEPDENREREALRGAFLSTADAATSLNSHSRLTDTHIEGAYNPEEGVSSRIKCEPLDEKESSDDVGGSAGQIITALRCRLKEKDKHQITPKCLICMEPYNKPVTSTQCWHVHCEECWLRTMGAKKLCPQCNMITAPADLRRIYL